jgi:hypothetical protein
MSRYFWGEIENFEPEPDLQSVHLNDSDADPENFSG